MKNWIKRCSRGVPFGKPQRAQRNTLRTLKEYPFKDITEKIISCVPTTRESSFFIWTRPIRKFI
jgi:hypothetical protein